MFVSNSLLDCPLDCSRHTLVISGLGIGRHVQIRVGTGGHVQIRVGIGGHVQIRVGVGGHVQFSHCSGRLLNRL